MMGEENTPWITNRRSKEIYRSKLCNSGLLIDVFMIPEADLKSILSEHGALKISEQGTGFYVKAISNPWNRMERKYLIGKDFHRVESKPSINQKAYWYYSEDCETEMVVQPPYPFFERYDVVIWDA